MDKIYVSNTVKPCMWWHALRKHLLNFEDNIGQATDVKTDEYDLCLETAHTKTKVQALVLEDPLNAENLLRLAGRMPDASSDYIVLLVAHDDDSASYNATLQQLQLHLLSAKASVIVLPVRNVAQIIPSLRIYLGQKTHNLDSVNGVISESQVLPYATSSVPRKLLSGAEVKVIQQICGSITELERYTRSAEGRMELSRYLDHRVLQSMIEFWQDEWIA